MRVTKQEEQYPKNRGHCSSCYLKLNNTVLCYPRSYPPATPVLLFTPRSP